MLYIQNKQGIEVMTSVYICGAGDCGQLGLGEDILDAKRPRKIKYFEDKNIIAVSSGGLHSLALSEEGKVYSWGCNDDCALGHNEPEFSIGEVIIPEKINQIACGDSISVAVTNSGSVYTWGTFRDSNGVLGHQQSVDIQKTPYCVNLKSKISDIAVGPNHVMIISEEGKVYSWGSGQQGQLGRRIIQRRKKRGLLPENVTPRTKRKFVKVSCGSYHSMCLDLSGEVYTCGLNNFGQLGQGDFNDRITFMPIKKDIFTNAGIGKIVDLSCGEHFSLLLDSKGYVYGVGRGDCGQLGVNENIEYSDLPIKSLVGDIVEISSGGFHSLAISKEGNVYSWGYGEMGQLGDGKEMDIKVPTKIEFDKKVIGVSGGGQHSVFLIE
eukprot:GHVP01037564.1.p1 GENE.GHVP01037564.1~~GHVP01037564.1.p1  ORF type:complete len:380 (-),score=66.01 GHVP01037564.1:1818-2957(-)